MCCLWPQGDKVRTGGWQLLLGAGLGLIVKKKTIT